MTNTESFQPNHRAAWLSVLIVAVLAALVVVGLGTLSEVSAPAAAPVATTSPVAPGLRVDSRTETTAVLDCLMDMGYEMSGLHLNVTVADRDWCRAAVVS